MYTITMSYIYLQLCNSKFESDILSQLGVLESWEKSHFKSLKIKFWGLLFVFLNNSTKRYYEIQKLPFK